MRPFFLLHLLLFEVKWKGTCSTIYSWGRVKFGKELQRINPQLDQITTLRYKWLRPRSNMIDCECIEWIHISLNTLLWDFFSPVPSPCSIGVCTRRLLIKFLEDRRISATSIAEQLGISCQRVGSIIHKDLDMRKLSAKWVPKCVKADQKRQRFQLSDRLLGFYRCDPNDFLLRM